MPRNQKNVGVLFVSGGYITYLNEEDLLRVQRISWHVLHSKMGRGNRYVRGTINGKKVLLHRLIMDASNGEQVDHIDGDTFNNRRENLRLCTNQQNCQNQKGKPRNSKFKGVRQIKGKWVARICLDGRGTHLGTFEKIEDAVSSYNEAAKFHFGEFARLNEVSHA